MSHTEVPMVNKPIPARAGIGLRPPHYQHVIDSLPKVPWFEVHSENFFADGGRPHEILEQVRANYPISLHGVGLSIGSTDPINLWHVNKLKSLIDRYQPGLVSEHLSWSSIDNRYLNDLLPLPYTEEALHHVSGRIAKIQDLLGRQLLIENLSSYLEFKASIIPEWEFLRSVVQYSGCAILLDVNNIYVNSINHGFDAEEYLSAIPVDAVAEIHLAGHTDESDILIDTHNKPVCPEVWQLYLKAVSRFGEVPSLIEWDMDLPDFAVLLNEAQKAQTILDGRYEQVA